MSILKIWNRGFLQPARRTKLVLIGRTLFPFFIFDQDDDGDDDSNDEKGNLNVDDATLNDNDE